MVSVAGHVSAGQIFTGSGVDTVIITGSLTGSATVRLDNSDSSEEAADSITIGNISSGVVYGESGADTFNINTDARKASLYGGGQNDLVTIGGSLSSGLVEAGEGADTVNVANLVSSTVKGELGNDLFSASAVVSKGALYGNKGNDSFVLDGDATSASTYGGAGNDSMLLGRLTPLPTKVVLEMTL